ncbi:MAG: damage-control phosphatase ARMT1 family protein [Candidatus Promineifilaceae bacterium]|jgi:hypothetical protein
MSEKSSSQSKTTQPALPIPPPITGDVPGTWANSTMSERVGKIARRTLSENEFSEDISSRVEALAADIPDGRIRFLDNYAPDANAWQTYTEPYLNQNWLTPPWFFTETYFYRRLIEATAYYEPGPGFGRDLFHYQKEQGLLTTTSTIQVIAAHLESWTAAGSHDEHIASLLAINLWGNRADLSLWPADESGKQPMDVDWEAAQAFTLANDTDAVISHLRQHPEGRIDIIADNAGLELVTDLALADYLLTAGDAEKVFIHLKPHPTFVSDAMISDVQATAIYLAEQKSEAIASFGRRLLEHLGDGSLMLTENPFWVSPLPFWEMPGALRQDLSRSNLIISKGDANYRRLLGDRLWPYTTPFAAILNYTPAPLLALRTLKAELACGLTEEQVQQLNEQDPQWLVNGRWGVIQFTLPGAWSSSVAGQ